jgi:hypothetical protein
MPLRHLRDVITLTIGATCVLSQVILQFQGGEPNIPLLTAGVSLLAGYPLLKLGDQRIDGADGP